MPPYRCWLVLAAAVASPCLLMTACEDEPATLVVDVASPASASPQYFHGNCLAGWSVTVDVRARETSLIEVVLETLSYRLIDGSTSMELGGDTLDRGAIESRYGTAASVLPAGTTRVFALGAVTPERPQGPLEVSGSLSGRDENGRAVSTSFNSVATVDVQDVDPPSGGACPPR